MPVSGLVKRKSTKVSPLFYTYVCNMHVHSRVLEAEPPGKRNKQIGGKVFTKLFLITL